MPLGGPRAGLLVVCLAAAPPATAGLVINELLPDPLGADEGREFVELLNNGDEPEPLGGVQFQFANGADGAVWQLRWTGADGDTVAPGARYLIVDRNWQGVPWDAQAALALQNGPDAVRLVRGADVLDLVGYGALTDPDLCEGAAVPVTAGMSLARRPDGRDTDRNDEDLVAAAPSPGIANFLSYDLAAVAWSFEPPSLAQAGDVCRLELTLRNDGTRTLPAAALVLRGGLHAPAVRLDDLPPDAERTVVWPQVVADAGRLRPVVTLPVDGTPDSVAASLGVLQVGPGQLGLSEVLAAPDQQQGEWVEIVSWSLSPVSLDSFRLRDEDGDWRALPPVVVGAGERWVLAQDGAALQAWLLDNAANGAPDACEGAAQRVVSPPGWPSLNNTAPEQRSFADRVYLGVLDPATSVPAVVDHVTWGYAGDPGPDGRSWERVAVRPPAGAGSAWAPCTAAAGGTPGCPNSVAVPSGAAPVTPELAIVPPFIDRLRGPTSLHLRFSVEAPAALWDAWIFDLWGQAVRDFGGDGVGSGPRDLLWDGQDDAGRAVAAGGYLALLVLRDASGCVVGRQKALLVVR